MFLRELMPVTIWRSLGVVVAGSIREDPLSLQVPFMCLQIMPTKRPSPGFAGP
jgi:hypothetical protein